MWCRIFCIESGRCLLCGEVCMWDDLSVMWRCSFIGNMCVSSYRCCVYSSMRLVIALYVTSIVPFVFPMLLMWVF